MTQSTDDRLRIEAAQRDPSRLATCTKRISTLYMRMSRGAWAIVMTPRT
jgi:hypothetical protein